jgi:hypothetical protein
MSDVNIQGDSNGEAGPEAPSQTSAEIFAAEVAALKASEEGGTKRASDYGVTSLNGDIQGRGDEGATEDPDQDDEQLDTGDELETEEEGSDSEESSDDSKSKRRNWKKEALESRQAVESLRQDIAELKQALRQPQPDNSATEGKAREEFKIPDIALEETELSQELKDLLEYTPGLDKMVTSLAAKTAKAIIDKAESDREAREQEKSQAQQQQESDKKYWSDLDSNFTSQYPELRPSEIRNSPDFSDWTTYHQKWVDAQLSSTAYDDPSGAQKVFERFVKENGLVKEQEPENDRRNLAAARTPTANRRSAPPAQDRRSLFQQEAERISSNKHRFRSTI